MSYPDQQLLTVKTVIGDCLYQFINPSRAFKLPPVILMNTPTSELFFLKHCETAGKLTLLLKGFGLDRYFPQLYSFRKCLEKTGPEISKFGTSAPWKQQKFSDFFFFFTRAVTYFLP